MPSKTVTKIIIPQKVAPEAVTATELRVAAYARVSSIKDAQENSLESQKDYFERYINYFKVNNHPPYFIVLIVSTTITLFSWFYYSSKNVDFTVF